MLSTESQPPDEMRCKDPNLQCHAHAVQGYPHDIHIPHDNTQHRERRTHQINTQKYKINPNDSPASLSQLEIRWNQPNSQQNRRQHPKDQSGPRDPVIVQAPQPQNEPNIHSNRNSNEYTGIHETSSPWQLHRWIVQRLEPGHEAEEEEQTWLNLHCDVGPCGDEVDGKWDPACCPQEHH